jgi:hypothetical protein
MGGAKRNPSRTCGGLRRKKARLTHPTVRAMKEPKEMKDGWSEAQPITDLLKGRDRLP